MQKKLSFCDFVSRRILFTAVICGAASCVVTVRSLAFFGAEELSTGSSRTLAFEQRVTYQRAIEEVYWRHRIWPKECPDPKPSLDAVMSQAQLENKVEDYLRDSQVLSDYWQRPITAEQLQAEMDRMAQNTRQPEVLQQLFEALGNDPLVIAECLARPALAERLISDLPGQDETERPESTQPKDVGDISTRVSGNVMYLLPKISEADSICTGNTWTPVGTISAPDPRTNHTAVWTGTEMIVWGGYVDTIYLKTGGRYTPAIDTWAATTVTHAPDGRGSHTAVWTGTAMIVWGGSSFDPFHLIAHDWNTGGRYNPATNRWAPTSLTNAPAGRYNHTAVWTGHEMIVWGGRSSFYDALTSGGKYNPSTNQWTRTSSTNAPAARYSHTAIWDGTEMIVWGGTPDGAILLNTGGRYSVATNSWRATSMTNAPSGRYQHTAIWTGSEMIVWGGSQYYMYPNTGGRYNPVANSWTPTSVTNAPVGRENHTAVWTGSKMIVWGGDYFYNSAYHFLNTGSKYNPVTNSWAATSTTNAPAGRDSHTAVWTGSQMIVWGGESRVVLNTGGRYCVPTP